MTVDKQKLREIIANLPRVQWSRTGSTVHIPETEDYAGKSVPITGLDKQYARNLAAYIAAVNPAAMTALLDEHDALIHDIGEYVRISSQQAEEIERKDAEVARLERNRDMWKGQCERQAAQIAQMRAALQGCQNLIAELHPSSPTAELAQMVDAALSHSQGVKALTATTATRSIRTDTKVPDAALG